MESNKTCVINEILRKTRIKENKIRGLFLKSSKNAKESLLMINNMY